MKTTCAILLAIIFGVIGIMVAAGYLTIEWLQAHMDWLP